MDITSANKIANARYFKKAFPTEEDALAHLEKIKWNGHPLCPRCGSAKVGKWRDDRPGWYRCNSRKCRKEFTAKLGTIFEHSRKPLLDWFDVWYEMMQHGGVSMKVGEDINAAQSTAWHMAHRIREAMRSSKEGRMLGGCGCIVEMDETFPGGKEGFKHQIKRLFPGAGYGGKKGALSMVERGDNGRRITVALPDKWIKNTKGKDIKTPDITEKIVRDIILRHIKPGTIIVTDDSDVYENLGKLGYERFKVVHKKHQYAFKVPDHPVIKKAHTNTVEGSHKGLKTRHRNHVHYSRKHAQRYYDETDFHWNEARKLKEKNGAIVFAKRRAPTVRAFEAFLRGCLGKTLPYEKLTGKPRNAKKAK